LSVDNIDDNALRWW